MDCKNCGKTVAGEFCGHCGQGSKVSRINLSNFLHEVSESIFQINRGFFYTLINLFTRPGNSIKDFIDGKRKSHFKPVAYILLFSTLYFLASRIAGEDTWVKDWVLSFLSYERESGAEIPTFLTWFFENFAYTNLLLLPIFSFASYLSFKGLGKNYLEHIVLNAYVAGQQTIFYSISVLLKMGWDSDILDDVPILLSVSYAFWVFWQFFAEGNRMMNLFRSVLTYILFMIFSTGLLFFFWDRYGI